MIRMLKDYVKTRPRLYDLIDSFRPIKSDVEKWLDVFSKENNRKVHFIQIGASDGLRWDSARKFIIRDEWSGIFVEPLPTVFEMLKKNYSYLKNSNLTFVNAAMSSRDDEKLIFYSYTEDFLNSLPLEDRMFFLRKSSFDKSFVERSLKAFEPIELKIREDSVPCLTMSSLVDRYWMFGKLDLIMIDAEGHDDEIIRSIDFAKIRPKAILYESHSLGGRRGELTEYLSVSGYRVTDFGGDSVAINTAQQ